MRKILLFSIISFFSFGQTPCLDAIANAVGAIGEFVPQCEEDGSYSPMQCWSSTGYCWCVDQYGNEIEGTSIPSWQGLPECEEIEYILGDINEDTLINVQDIIFILNLVLNNQYNSLGDINLDSELDVLDVVTLVGIILNR